MEHLIHNIGYFSEIKTAIPVIMKNCILKNKTSEKLYVIHKEKEGKPNLQMRNTYRIICPFHICIDPLKTQTRLLKSYYFLSK